MKVTDEMRYAPLYTPADISRYAHVYPGTLRTWTGGRGRALLIQPAARTIAPFSFVNLIEAHVVVALRKMHNVSMPRVRRAMKWLSREYQTDHPLAEIDLETDGRDVFVDHLDLKISASEGGQVAIPEVVSRYLSRIERDQAGPVRFYPFTTYESCPKFIVMDPRVDFGRPVIEGTRIETVMIFERYSGGEGLAQIAEDYDLDLAKVEEALRCEIERRAA
ncbi:MAG: DUF433 domain-containing protein [Planctomycetota bacterium]